MPAASRMSFFKWTAGKGLRAKACRPAARSRARVSRARLDTGLRRVLGMALGVGGRRSSRVAEKPRRGCMCRDDDHRVADDSVDVGILAVAPVSYIHMTLPTIYPP